MAPITKEMLRKRAEHNEGMISTLKEVSLHQQEIEKIENLGNYCRELEILYLQNNLIGRLENLRRLKDLQYLNVAVNNIKLIENLERCESLNKLDLTVNFLDLEGLLSVTRLRANYQLRDLYLTGNPCTDFDGYRKFVVASLPQLKRLDGKEIPHSERIEALQDLPAIKERLIKALQAKGVDVQALMENPSGGLDDDEEDYSEDDEEPMYNDKGERVRRWSAKTRIIEHREMVAAREAAEKQKTANKDDLLKAPPAPPRRTGFDPLPEGKIYQKNEGKWDFELLDAHDGESILLDVGVGKFMDTSLMDVDVQPHAVRVLIKGRLLQLALPEEVMPDKSFAQRSKVTGHLLVTMPKLDPQDISFLKRAPAPDDGKPAATKACGARQTAQQAGNGKGVAGGAGVSVHNLVKRAVGEEDDAPGPAQIKEASARPVGAAGDAGDDDFVDDDEVPPLE